MKKYIVIGNGNLGSSLANYLKSDLVIHIKQTRNLERVLDELRIYYKKISEEQICVINTVGIINTSISNNNEVNLVNVQFPLNLIQTCNQFNFQLITIGTIMENFPIYCWENIYLESKLKFFKASQKYQSPNHLHLQLHTIYGGKTMHKNMFLSKFFYSLRSETTFEMSEGEQIREYHHVLDDCGAILKAGNHFRAGILDLSSGFPVKLRVLVSDIAKSLNLSHLISRGKIPRNMNDNFSYSFSKRKFLEEVNFRNPIEGVLKYYKSNRWIIK